MHTLLPAFQFPFQGQLQGVHPGFIQIRHDACTMGQSGKGSRKGTTLEVQDHKPEPGWVVFLHQLRQKRGHGFRFPASRGSCDQAVGAVCQQVQEDWLLLLIRADLNPVAGTGPDFGKRSCLRSGRTEPEAVQVCQSH